MSSWFVYVIQSLQPRFDSHNNPLPGFFYVGCTTDPARRLKEHNGLLPGGGKYTAKHRPWKACALYGPYDNRSDAMKAEYALKHTKRGISRTQWVPTDSIWCRGLGPDDPWVKVSL
jgi:structure-specific endonuclease subunit SLX1